MYAKGLANALWASARQAHLTETTHINHQDKPGARTLQGNSLAVNDIPVGRPVGAPLHGLDYGFTGPASLWQADSEK